MAAPAIQNSLHHRPLFSTLPAAIAVVDAFKRHIANTASPETFELISMTRPPENGDVVVLHTFSLDRRKRTKRDMAPCPICSPEHEKYLEDGALIWCEASASIYAIGPQCAGGLWKDGRVDRAIAKFRAAEDVARSHKLLIARMLSVPEMRDWIKAEFPLALAVDSLARSFRQEGAFLWGPLHTASRERDGTLEAHEAYYDLRGEKRYRHVPLGRLTGRSFLREGGAIAAKFSEIDRSIARYDGGRDHQARLDHAAELSPDDRRKGPSAILEAYQSLKLQADLLKAPLDFFTSSNMSLILQWREDGHGRLSAFKWVGSRVIAEGYDKYWEASLDNLRQPSPLPLEVR